MSYLERVFHAILFEVSVIILSIFALSVFIQNQTGSVSIAVILISVIAMLWNFIFNIGFDYFFTEPREQRTILIRILHTVSFESGLLIFTLPLIAYILNMELITAFITDIGLTLIIMSYTFIFNWAYDHLRALIINKKSEISAKTHRTLERKNITLSSKNKKRQ